MVLPRGADPHSRPNYDADSGYWRQEGEGCGWAQPNGWVRQTSACGHVTGVPLQARVHSDPTAFQSLWVEKGGGVNALEPKGCLNTKGGETHSPGVFAQACQRETALR